MMADAGPAILDGGDETMDAGLPNPTGGMTSGGFRYDYEDDDGLIPPGVLIPGQSYVVPVRRHKSRKKPAKTIPALRLPLYTYPRNVKP